MAIPGWGIGKALRAPPADVLRNTRLNSEMANFCFSSDDQPRGRNGHIVAHRKTKRKRRMNVLTCPPRRCSSDVMFEPQPPCSNRQPSTGRGSGRRRIARGYLRRIRRVHRATAHTRTHYCDTTASRRRPSFSLSPTWGCATAQASLSIAGQPHGMATAGATHRVRRFKRYVTISTGPLIGRRSDHRPIGRVLAESRGKTKCSVTVARRSQPRMAGRSSSTGRSPTRGADA